ncbi:MAG: ABC transporter transmembrane domain-containing protein, partial [Proteobacteria bacterium]|nr:ABC transporter transmembrane domain-containing protein [Pseudomonadota bacterium]
MLRASPLRRLFKYSAKYRHIAIQGSVFSLANKFFDVAPEILIGIAIDVVVRQDRSFLTSFGLNNPKSQIITLVIVTMFIWIAESVFEYLYSLRWQTLAQLVQHDLRMDAYAHLQNLDLTYFEDKESGSMTSILSDDINQLERFLNNGANALLQVAGAVVFIGAAFLAIDPEIALVAIAPIPFILWGASRFQKLSEPLYANVRKQAGAISGRLQANITGMATIKAFGSEYYEADTLRTLSQTYVAANLQAIKTSSAFTPLIRMAILLGFVGTLLLGAFKALNGSIEVGSFGVLVFLTQRLLWPFTTLSQVVDQYQRAAASCNRVMNMLETKIEQPLGSRVLDSNNVQGHIEIKNLSFAYTGRSPVFSNLSMRIPAGKTVAIVGPTGSGKSSLAKLILRLYEP